MNIKLGKGGKPLMVGGKVVTNCGCCSSGGACCVSGVCSDVASQSACQALGGDYLGDGTVCHPTTCTCWDPGNGLFQLSQIDLFGSANVSGIGGSNCEAHVCPDCDTSSACGPYPGDGCARINPSTDNCRATMSAAIEVDGTITNWRLTVSAQAFCGTSCGATQSTAWFDIATVIPTGTFFFSWGCGDASFSASVTIAP